MGGMVGTASRTRADTPIGELATKASSSRSDSGGEEVVVEDDHASFHGKVNRAP